MNFCLQDMDVFIDNEISTLKYLSKKFSLRGMQNVAQSAHDASYQIANTRTKGFSLYFKWSVFHKEQNALYDIHVGGKLDCDKKEIKDISYFFSITQEEAKNEHLVLRKYHFDYTKPENDRRNPHPIFHLQLPGKLPPKMQDKNFKINHLFPKLSEPRIFYFPMSLSLVFHFAFSEFVHDSTEKIRKDGGWLFLINRDQKNLWKPYISKCLEHIENKKIIFDEAYAT